MEYLRIYTVNSKSDEVLDYKKYEREGHGLTAIAVGGLSLSRGLTIEGLCVSYMYRNTRMYDTLMQMGRWFGYRTGYEDLCRVHLSEDSINWYAHIAEASEELRHQIRGMRRANLSPKQFGLYVKAHPDSLLITAPGKMRSGEPVIFKQNLGGRLVESYILPADDKVNQKNEELIAKHWKAGFGGHPVTRTEKGWFVKDVSVEVIEQFLYEFENKFFSERKFHVVEYLRKLSDRYPKGDVLLISLHKNVTKLAQYRLGAQARNSARLMAGKWRMSKDRVASRGDEKLGLTEQQQREAENSAHKESKKPSDKHYRSVRNKPLLMIHVIKPGDQEQRVPALGISFPDDYETEIEVEVVANSVWMQEQQELFADSPEQEDDYDE